MHGAPTHTHPPQTHTRRTATDQHAVHGSPLCRCVARHDRASTRPAVPPPQGNLPPHPPAAALRISQPLAPTAGRQTRPRPRGRSFPPRGPGSARARAPGRKKDASSPPARAELTSTRSCGGSQCVAQPLVAAREPGCGRRRKGTSVMSCRRPQRAACRPCRSRSSPPPGSGVLLTATLRPTTTAPTGSGLRERLVTLQVGAASARQPRRCKGGVATAA